MKGVKNGRHNNNNTKRRTAAAAATVTGNTNNDGDRVRSNDGNESPSVSGDSTGQIGTDANGVNVGGSLAGNPVTTITDGWYFTPRGTVERIPDGHYIGVDGRLRKRRQGRTTDNAADGNTRGDRSETSEQTEFVSEDFLLAKPLNVRGKRKTKFKEEATKVTLVTMLATASVALFSSIELITKHEHWALEKAEAGILAEALNEALSTLPAKYYDSIIGVIEKYVPWINLIFVIGAIVIPRIEASSKRIEEKHYQPNKVDDKRDAGTEDNPFSNFSSLGWNGRR